MRDGARCVAGSMECCKAVGLSLDSNDHRMSLERSAHVIAYSPASSPWYAQALRSTTAAALVPSHDFSRIAKAVRHAFVPQTNKRASALGSRRGLRVRTPCREMRCRLEMASGLGLQPEDTSCAVAQKGHAFYLIFHRVQFDVS